MILILSKVSLSKTVTQSLPLSLPLSICQSAVSHSLIQSVPRLLSLSVSRSFSHSVPLSLYAHLTSSSFTHQHFPFIHLSTRLARFLTVSSSLLASLFPPAVRVLTLWKKAPRFLFRIPSLYLKPWPQAIHLVSATYGCYFAWCLLQLLWLPLSSSFVWLSACVAAIFFHPWVFFVKCP